MATTEHRWMDQPVHTLTREELLEVIDYLAGELKRATEDRSKWMAAADPLKYLMQERT